MHLILRLLNGGGERDRTDDLMLAKHALSQLSYAPISSFQKQAFNPSELRNLNFAASNWWAREDSNLRPHAYQAHALTN